MSYIKFLNQKRKLLTILVGPTPEQYTQLNKKFKDTFGIDNTFEHRDDWDKMVAEVSTKLVHTDMSFKEVLAIAEPIRIANPEVGVSIFDESKANFIGNVTWNDQMKMFFEYPTYTPEGAALAKARQEEAAKLGIIAGWE